MKTFKLAARRVGAVAMFPVLLAALLVRVLALDIFDDAWDWFSGGVSAIFDQIRHLISGLFRHFVNFLSSVISFTADALWSGIQWVGGVADYLFNQAMNTINWFVGVLWGAIQGAINLAEWLVGNVTNALNWFVGVLWGAIQDVWRGISNAINDITSWAIQNIWNPLMGGLTDIVRFATHDLPNWVNGIVNNLWCFVRDVAGSITNIASGVFNDLIGPFKVLLDLGLKAIEWIGWMAFHPFGWFVDLVNHFFDHGSDWFLDKMSNAITDNVDRVDTWLAKFFE